ncbi:MAG: cytochrome o ubiquinol oxidase subunit IV [Candidatus Saccharimonadaceae bacterium]
MKKPQLETHHSSSAYLSYVVGFALSIFSTLLAYFFVVNHLLPKETLIYVVLAIAVIQLIVQVVFFLHIGHGSRWKLLTFIFTVLVVGIVVVGSIWIMQNLNYNMMDMTPDQMQQYMKENEGI